LSPPKSKETSPRNSDEYDDYDEMMCPNTGVDHLFCLGVAQLDNGRLKAARQTFLKVVRLGKYEGEAWLKIAHTYFLSDDKAECEKALRKAIAAEPENNAAWHVLGMALVEQGRVSEAEDAVRSEFSRHDELPCRRGQSCLITLICRHSTLQSCGIHSRVIPPSIHQIGRFDAL